MRKKIFSGIAVLAIAVVSAWNVSLNAQQNSKLSATMLANLEALAGECPDVYDVPDHYIQVKTQTVTLTSNFKGEISFKDVVKSGFEKNKQIAVIISEYNCDGVQVGSCCKQSEVRVELN